MDDSNGRTKTAKLSKITAAVAVLIFTAFWFSCSTKGADETKVAENASAETRAESVNTSPQPAAAAPLGETLPPPPVAYRENCARCHGAKGEGVKNNPELTGVTTRPEDAFTEADLLEIINDAGSFGLSSKMPSFKNKLTENEKQEIIGWLKTLK